MSIYPFLLSDIPLLDCYCQVKFPFHMMLEVEILSRKSSCAFSPSRIMLSFTTFNIDLVEPINLITLCQMLSLHPDSCLPLSIPFNEVRTNFINGCHHVTMEILQRLLEKTAIKK